MRKDGPPKLQKSDGKSKIIDLDELKDKASTIKDKTRDRTKSKIRDKNRGSLSRGRPLSKEGPAKLAKTDQKKAFTDYLGKLKNLPVFNNRKMIFILIFIILIGAAGVLAINNIPTSTNKTNNTTVTPPIPENHFDNGIISFDYPKGWNVTNGSKAPVLVTVSKDENTSFVVMNEKLNKTTFTERVLLWRQNILQSGQINYENNITIDNKTGYNIEASYRVNNTTFNARAIAVSKNETVYFIMFIFDRSLLDYKNEMEQVINSFHILH